MDQKEYLKELHKVEVEILDEIDKVCKKNNIKYFIVGGTLLGAVRHKGFIPWDDDIDIGMLRSDYEKFKNICLDNKALSKKYFLHCHETDENYWLPFMKVRKNNTTFDEQFINSLNRHKGIFVDIFPFDDIDKENGFFNKIRAFLTLKTTEAIHCKFKLRNPNTCRRKIVVKFLMLFKKKKLDKFQKKLLTFKNGKDLDYVCCFIGGANPFAELVKKDKSFPLISISFEGKEYPCFNNYELYLERLYGDYMTLPPKDKRVTHMPSSVSFTSGKNLETKRK